MASGQTIQGLLLHSIRFRYKADHPMPSFCCLWPDHERFAFTSHHISYKADHVRSPFLWLLARPCKACFHISLHYHTRPAITCHYVLISISYHVRPNCVAVGQTMKGLRSHFIRLHYTAGNVRLPFLWLLARPCKACCHIHYISLHRITQLIMQGPLFVASARPWKVCFQIPYIALHS